MKLAILTQYYVPEVGAPQVRLSELARLFVERGHSVTVLTAMPNYPSGQIHAGYGGLLRRERIHGAAVCRVPIYPTQRVDFVHRVASYASFAGSAAALGSWLLPRPDFLLVESPPLLLGLSAIWLARLKRTRLIFNVSDLWPDSAVRLGALRANGLAHRLALRLEAACYRRAWMVTGQSREIVSDISHRFPGCRTYHLSNGVDCERFRPDRRSAVVRANLGPTSSCIALYAGLHGLAQGLDQIVDAAALLNGSGIDLVLVGDGPEKAALVTRAAAQSKHGVRFLAAQPHQVMPELVASADILVVPLREHLPGAVPSKLYEAMASGRPVVLMAAGEAAAIIRKHEAGVVVPPGDVPGLAAALRCLAANPQLRDRFGQNARRAAEEHYDRAGIATRFISLLEAAK
jgi:colanic acid biosynthesis glycosyl transferase WcaI